GRRGARRVLEHERHHLRQVQGGEVTGVLRGKTLGEKNYGPGYRPSPLLSTVAKFTGCGIEGCADPVYGSIELYVDEVPPLVDWYSKLLRSLQRNVYVRVGFCQGHLADVVQRSTVEGWD